MPRIAKAEVNQALSLAAKSILEAGGRDGRVSRAEVKAKLKELPAEQRALVDVFFKFIDHRDFKAGAQVTKKDVEKAVAYAKRTMIAKYDLNSNGLSKDEISKMSLTGKLAVDLAKALKKAGTIDPPVDDGPILPPRIDEGLSEPDEILAAGQVPRDWTPAAHVQTGFIHFNASGLERLETTTPLTPELKQLADAAMGVLWDRTFAHRIAGETSPLEVGSRREGTLKLGSFTRRDDGKTYLVADWRDIDDASFTLYFQKLPSGKLRLAIEQFNN